VIVRAAIVAGLLAMPAAHAEHLDQRTQETRTVLYYHVPDEALARVLPQGWHPAAIIAGPARGANLTVNLSEQISATTADGKVAGDARGRALTLSARVRDDASADDRAMVLFGITTGSDAPGPYGTHHLGTVALDRMAVTGSTGPTQAAEHWDAKTGDGDRFELTLRWTRGDVVPGHVDQQTRSSLHPKFYRIYKIDSFSDVVRSEAGQVDHAGTVQAGSAGRVADLLKGAGRLVAVVSVPIYEREIWLP
jgi:hypothetical protein